ncbi:hypothetical protein [Neisseria shayeganii]|uniref:Uncharacterized protein n=1 Tax=Neisseria shayeganii TaxID=607712 RepID=A0A7D7NCW7_9NEIS|nr:hypothetical protein [Neisseria shayeganii]QMT41118.1 hypothetical protein H3L94_03520 [Neisseria shayeganii]
MSQIVTLPSTAETENVLSRLTSDTSVTEYQQAMRDAGRILCRHFVGESKHLDGPVLVVSTAEDADFLTTGFLSGLDESCLPYKLAVFWNNHYSLPSKDSVAPIVHEYVQEGYRECRHVVLLKSIISGSCVVRTNLAALLTRETGEVLFSDILVAAPVMLDKSHTKLKDEFSSKIHEAFRFCTLRVDKTRLANGVVVPGIGGEVYPRLGLKDQPARLPGGYMPELVRAAVFGLKRTIKYSPRLTPSKP